MSFVGAVLMFSDIAGALTLLCGAAAIVMGYDQATVSFVPLLLTFVVLGFAGRIVAGAKVLVDPQVNQPKRWERAFRYVFVVGWDASRYLRGTLRDGQSDVPSSHILLWLAFSVLNAACQVQTNSLELCESLQQQGGAVMDATCWLRGNLDPTALVSPGVLVSATPRSTLTDVLNAIDQEGKIVLQDGTEFANDVSSFQLQCVNFPKRRQCAWTLTSRPTKPLREVFPKSVMDAIDWIQLDT